MREPESLRYLQQTADVRLHLGVIDVGSNAIRLQVAKVFVDGSFSVVHDEREPVRLGEEVFRTGELSSQAVRRALDTLVRYSAIARKHGAEHVRSVATSAVREAHNGADFAQQVEQSAGLKLEIITGAQEARLIARGVLSSFNAQRSRVVLVDIGGGSTEISVVDRGMLGFSGSIPVGSVRLTEMFCRSDPLLPGHERALREYVRGQLALAMGGSPLDGCPNVVGSAGTIGALANFIRRRPSTPRSTNAHSRSAFTVRELNAACSALCKMSLVRRRKAPGVEERRAEIIVAGAIILEEVCSYFKAKTVKVMRRGLRDGLMLEEIERLIGDDGPRQSNVSPKNPRRRPS